MDRLKMTVAKNISALRIILVRGEPKINKKTGQPQRHRANGKVILAEAGKERYSSSATLDRTRSYLNVYEGFESGLDCWDAMCEEANQYRTVAKGKDGKLHERRLKSDAVIGGSVIFKLPCETCKDWDLETHKRFGDDSWEVLCEIKPEIFRDENVRMRAFHFDEGYTVAPEIFGIHEHRLFVPKDTSGRYCGNLIDAKLLAEIDKLYPAKMRERGWDMDDLDTTDWERMKTDEEYREERKRKWSKQGRSVNKYLEDMYAKKLAEVTKQGEQIKEIGDRFLQQTRDERTRAENDGNEIRRSARKNAQEITAEAENDAEKLREDAKKAADEYQSRMIAEANAEAVRIRDKAKREAQEEIEQIKEEAKQERDQILADARQRGRDVLEGAEMIADERLNSIDKLEKDALETLSPKSVFEIAVNVLRSVVQYAGKDALLVQAANDLLNAFSKWRKFDKKVELLTRGARGVPRHRLTADRRKIAENQEYMKKARRILADDEPSPSAPSEPELG